MSNTKDTPIDYKQFEGHTPEPWIVRTAKEFIKPKTFEIINHDGLLIAYVNIGMFDVEQNSKLLAAAPDLLKENKSLKLELQKLQNDLDDALSFKNGKGPTAVYIASLRSELQKQKELNAELVKEVEQLILHAEEDSLNYSVLEHARKLVFKITHPEEYARYQKTNTNVLPDMRQGS